MNQSLTRSRDYAIHVSAAAVSLLGLVVMLGWHAKLDWIVQLKPTFPPMQYNTALCFLLSGISVLCLSRARAIALVCGLMVFGLAGASLLEHGMNADLGIDQLLMNAHVTVATYSAPGRMSPQTAFAFLFASAALVALAAPWSLARRTWTIEILGSLLGAVGLAAVVAYVAGIEEVLGARQLKRMALHTAVACVVLAFAIVESAWRLDRAKGFRDSRLVALPVGIGAVAVTLSLFQALVAWQTAKINDATTRTVERASADLRSRVSGYLESFGMLADAWGRAGGQPERSWETDVARFLRDHDVFQAISWADADGKFRWIFPLEPFPDYIGFDYTTDTERLSALVAARDRAGALLTKTITLKSGLPGLLMLAPLQQDGGRDGPFVVGAIRINDLFRSSALMLPGYSLEVLDGDRLIYSSTDTDRAYNDWTRAAGVQVDHAKWVIRVTPSPPTLDAMSSPLPLVVLLAGLFASTLLALAAHLAQVSRRRARELLATNDELSAAKNRLERLALFDELTGLGNRNLLTLELDKQLAASKRHALPLPLLLMDLDGFKAINDTFGHEAGDAVLREFGIRLQRALREGDHGFRAGGDEFAVLARPGTSLDEALGIARKITEATSKPLVVGTESRVVSASVGIALYPDHARERERLMRSADAAMYKAKHDATRVHVATEESPTAVLRALQGGRERRT